MKVGRTFLSARINVLLTVERIEEIPHRRFPLSLSVEVALTLQPISVFPHAHSGVPYRKMHQKPWVFCELHACIYVCVEISCVKEV